MSKSQICVGVVFGGVSNEHNVSIRSAKTVVNALSNGLNSTRFEIVCIYIDQKGRWWNYKIASKALIKGIALEDKELSLQNLSTGFTNLPKESTKVDIWFPVLHGPNGEDGSIQGFFKLIGKPFVGSGVLGSALGMDKLAMKAAFKAAGLPQTAFESAESPQIRDPDSLEQLINRLEQNIAYPCFIKPANLGSSVGISKAHNRQELVKGLDLAAHFDDRLVIEKNINARELECGVLGKKNMQTSVVGEIKHNSTWYDYEAKYSSNKTEILIPAPIPKKISEEIRQLSLKACSAISVDSIARVDFFYNETNNEVLINEVNTLPGFTNQSMFPMLWSESGLNIEALVAKLVQTAQE